MEDNSDKNAKATVTTPHVFSGWRYLLVYPVCALVKLWLWTIRFKMTDESRKAFTDRSKPSIFVLWHNRIICAPAIFPKLRPGRKLYCLVSTSKDGAWLTAFFRAMGVYTARGSSSKRASTAMLEMLRRLEEGNDVGLTPDGPRGPVYIAKKGAMKIAEMSNSPIVIGMFAYKKAIRFKSWDRFAIPYPFSEVEFKCIRFENIKALTPNGEDSTERIQEVLMSVTDDSDLERKGEKIEIKRKP